MIELPTNMGNPHTGPTPSQKEIDLSDRQIIAGLTGRIAELLPSWYGDGAALLSPQPEREDRPYSVLLHYAVRTADGQEANLIAKIPHPVSMVSLAEMLAEDNPREFCKLETETLSAIEQAIRESGNPNLTAIRAHAFLDEFNAVVMEFLPMVSFKQQYLVSGPRQMVTSLLGTKTTHPDFPEKIRYAGQWLRLFHGIRGEIAFQTLVELAVGQTLAELLEEHSQSSASAKFGIADKFKNAYQEIALHSVPAAVLHDDFHFGNIFLADGGKVGGFDPNWGRHGAIYEDLARAITEPQIRLWMVLTRGRANKKIHDQMETNFLAGYNYPVDARVLGFFCALALLDNWVQVEEKLKRGVPKLLSTFIGRYYAGLIEEYLSLV